jgi:xylulokinase
MFIGIDLGTSSVKLILVKSTGQVVKSTSRSFDLLMPRPMWTEQNPNDWYDQVMDGLSELVQGYESNIEAIGFSGQMHGLVLLDEHDQVIRPAILWNDQRTIEQNQYLNEVIGIERLLQYTGNISLTGLTAPKVLWVKAHEPELFQKISKVMLPKDYIAYRLSGVFATDVSDVSGTLYYDCANKTYSQEMLHILGLKINQLPKVYESHEVIGHLKADISAKLNITKPIKIVIGGGDQAVGAVGVGIVEDGKCSISLGTSGVVFVATDKFKIDHQSYLQSYRHANGKCHLMGVMLSAAGALNWWSEKVFKTYNYGDFFDKIEKTPLQDSLYFLPYLSGERSPINDPMARGVFFGLQLQHRKEHMDRALVEGVTFALKQTLELIQHMNTDIKSLRITGGGAKSKVWAQMIADVMNVDVSTIEIEEGPSLGAAILAMVGAEVYPSVAEACRTIIKEKDVFKPIASNVVYYEKKYQVFKTLYPSMKALFPRLDVQE